MSFRFLGGRLILALLSLWGVSVLAFVILRIVPGDPALLMAPVGSTAQDIARIRDVVSNFYVAAIGGLGAA